MKKSLLRFTVGAALSAIAGVACFGQHYINQSCFQHVGSCACHRPSIDQSLGHIPRLWQPCGGFLTTQRDSARSTTAQEPSNP